MTDNDKTPEPEFTSESETAAILADPVAMAAIAEAEAEQFNPLQTWDEVVRDLGEPNLGPVAAQRPEEDLAR